MVLNWIFWLFILKSGFGQETFSLDYQTSVGTRRMFNPVTRTRKIGLAGIENRTQYARQDKDWLNTRHTRSRNRKRKTRKSAIRGSTTFSRLLNFDPSFATFSNNRYSRQSVSLNNQLLNNQEKLLRNIADKLDLLDLACRIQRCSKHLKRLILQQTERRSSSQNRLSVG